MRRGQGRACSDLMDAKSLNSSHALKLGKSIERDLGTTRDELQKCGLLTPRQRRHDVPKPLHLLVGGPVSLVGGVLLQIEDINVGKTRNEQFQLLGCEDGDELRPHHLVEALQEGLDLALDRCCHPMLADKADVFLLALLGDLDVAAVGYQVNGLEPSEAVIFDGKSQLQSDIVEIVLQDELEILVIVGIDGFHIVMCRFHSQHVLVKASSEVRIEQIPIGDRLAHNPTDETEVMKMVRVDAAVGIRLEGTSILGGRKQGIVGIEHLLGQNGKEFARETSGVNALFVAEGDAKAASHLFGVADRQLVVGVLKHMFTSDMQA
mmetsp:Transcript_7909/g.21999  ORF Transcript_7909/g.21999 Transcript_7909/m.21999 type:complete len:321 (-) Transcript_7909:2972-3934(-)